MLLAPIPCHCLRADTGGAALPAGAVADEGDGGAQQLMVQRKELLREAHAAGIDPTFRIERVFFEN